MSKGILQGVRVLDLAAGAAGSVAALQLSEAGAQVIKIEPPGGAPLRGSPGFAVWNRGKKSVVLDLATAEDRASLDRLLAASDVLIHEFTPREASARGLDDAALRTRFPHLIVSAASGWPSSHPDAERPPRETLVLARLGLMAEQPGHRAGPVFIRMPYASFCTAWLCAIGVVARLIQRGRGRGVGPAHTSLAQGALIPMTMHWARAETPSASFARGLDKSVAVAIHQCSDGEWIHVHYAPDAAPYMREALDALGPDGVAAANARWGKNHTAPNFGANREIFATRPAREWLEHLWAHDVAAQPAAPFGAVYFDEQARVNGYIAEVDDPQFGMTLQPGPAYSVTPPARVAHDGLRPLGADTQAVFETLAPRPTAAMAGAATAPPLEGIRILDFGAYLAGPFGAMLLADLGADVIKVEPTSGDVMRYLDRVFCGCQRGKRSVALNLKDPRIRPVVEALARWADAFHHNMRLPAARKLGLDYESLRAANPALVGCHISSYGPAGARADWPGFDQLFQAACGWEVENGGDGNPPMWLRFGVCDHLAALASAYALLLGLYHRDRTGAGQMTSASLLGATILSTGETVVHADGGVDAFARLDREQTGVSSFHRLYACKDGWVAVAALTDDEQIRFAKLVQDDAQAFFAARDRYAVEALLEDAGIAASVVREDQHDAFLDDPGNRAADLVMSAQHTTQGQLEQIGAFWNLGDARALPERAAPALGEHSREVLAALGLPEAEIEALAGAGLIAG
ncbi:coA-transferase III family protein [Paraburkholderia xenovorans LB400]|uniref:Acyl-CoA transferase n=1 Tax=Paraburkholderia xenovorans (strain LB400) TaxID=266265 RepID=Q13HE1_PARXL|nr:CoA transferase [Paraburkholderia xenovorans]ABE36498.1 Putative acyl-CoA transferase [Paraburkholderia xenovorans LB400]AIP34305.1 coA-transferase III family protein [Paraburkholderia xenovorans LB400]